MPFLTGREGCDDGGVVLMWRRGRLENPFVEVRIFGDSVPGSVAREMLTSKGL